MAMKTNLGNIVIVGQTTHVKWKTISSGVWTHETPRYKLTGKDYLSQMKSDEMRE